MVQRDLCVNCDIALSMEEVADQLPTEYYEFLDVFDKSKVNELPPYRSYDHKIELEF